MKLPIMITTTTGHTCTLELIDDNYIMKGATGTHRLSEHCTDTNRLQAHWSGFVDNNGGMPLYDTLCALKNASNASLDEAIAQATAENDEAVIDMLFNERSRRINDRQQGIALSDLEWEKEIEQIAMTEAQRYFAHIDSADIELADLALSQCNVSYIDGRNEIGSYIIEVYTFTDGSAIGFLEGFDADYLQNILDEVGHYKH